VLHAASCKYRTQKSPKIHHLGTIAQLCQAVSLQLRHISKKNVLSTNTSSTCPHNMMNFSPLASEVGPVLWGTPSNFSRFRILAAFLQRCRLPEANQTLHDVWPSPGPLRYVYIFGGSCPVTEFCRCKIHFTSMSCFLLYWQRYCTALQQRASAKLCSMVQGMGLRNFRRGRHLYSARRPSRCDWFTF